MRLTPQLPAEAACSDDLIAEIGNQTMLNKYIEGLNAATNPAPYLACIF